MRAHSVAVLIAAFALPFQQAEGAPCDGDAVRLVADLAQSTIRWKGTKFFGLGSHEGIVRLSGGEVCMRNGRVQSATFIADMRTIEVTDIPESEPVPRRRLREHLLGEDFFHAQRHPQAVLRIDSVVPTNRSVQQVHARLTIRGITHPVAFYARLWESSDSRLRAQGAITVDRHRWNVSYRGSNIRDDLVDDEFTLQLALVASRP